MVDNVTPLFAPADNGGCVNRLRDLLQKAEAGEIVGLACVAMNKESLACYTLVGSIGSFSALGAMELAKIELAEMLMDDAE